MPSTDPNVQSVSCPACSARYEFPAQLSGRKGRCSKCGTVFIVPTASAAPAAGASLAAAKHDESAEPAPEHVGFECRICQTRLYARVQDVGKKMKCPDCHALTVIPAPPPPKKKDIPAALEGEQYELWGVDEAPLPSALLARQPKYIAISCSVCTTLMYALPNQVGHSIKCPDCGTSHIVPAPPKSKPKQSVLAPDALTPKIDRAADPGPRPVLIAPRKEMLYEARQEAEYAAALEKSRRTGRPMEIDARGRPVLPRWPLISGTLPFLFSRGVPVRWFALTAAYYASLSLVFFGLELAMSGGMAAIAGMCFFAIGGILTMLSSAFAASVLMATITESSEGNREIQDWPTIHDWFAELLAFIVAGMVSAVPGYFAAKLLEHYAVIVTPLHIQIFIAGAALVFLPIVLLSQLDIGSPWGVLSGRVLASLIKCPFSWAFFYVETALLALLCGGLTYRLVDGDPANAIWLLPLYVAAAILFARLLGRLGWRLAETLPPRRP